MTLVTGEARAVGDPYAAVGNLTHAGAVYVYDLAGKPEFAMVSKKPQMNGGFGFSLATDGQRLAVGEPARALI